MFKDYLNSKLTGAILNADTGLKAMPKSQAHESDGGCVQFGYGQVEPNHLSAQRTAQIYAQLPANPEIEILEQGQFVKYDYAANDNGIGEVNFKGKGEWMLVYNEIKLYRNHIDGTKQWDCEFAMIKDDYQARVYTPYDWEAVEEEYHNGLRLNGKDEKGNTEITIETAVTLNASKKTVDVGGVRYAVTPVDGDVVTYTFTTEEGDTYTTTEENPETFEKVKVTYQYDDVTLDTEDIYEYNFTNDPWGKLGLHREKKMRPGTSMVPRVFKTNVGDIFTTNMIAAKFEDLNIGDVLTPGEKGILEVGDGDMQWQVVKKYTMPDGQNGVKIMRIA